MKYDRIIENNLKKLSSLQRVRIKTDPQAFAKEGAPEDCPSYEGYILEEDLENIKVAVLSPDLSVKKFNLNDVEMMEDDSLTELKCYILTHLGTSADHPINTQINNSTNINEIEAFLKQHGLDAEEICDLYGKFITS